MGTIKKVGEKSYNQDANGDWHEVESPVQKEPENAKVLNGITYYKDDAGNWYEGEKVSQKKNDGQPSKTGGQEPKPSGKAPSPSPSPSPFQDDKSKTREQIAREDFESSMPFLTEKIKINQPGDIMTGQQRNQMAASKVKSDKIENYRTQVLPQKVKEEKEKAKQASLKPEAGEQFNPVDFATSDIATYSGGASLNLDPKAPSKDKFNQLNQFFGNDASNVAPYFDNRVKAVDKQIAQIKQNPMLWRSLNQGKSDIAEIEKLKDYKLKLAAASNKLATDYTAWLYPDESLERKGEIQRKLSGDGSVNQEIAFKEKGIPLTDEQKFNNAKIGIDVERTRLENDYRDVPPDQRDDAYYQRLAQVDNMDETLLNQFPDYKKSQVGMMVAQLASQDPNIDASSLIGFIPQDLDQKTINYISEKYKIPKEDLQGLQYGDIPDESILSNVRKGALGLTAGFITGATRILGSALGVDSDRLTYVNNKISGLPDYIAGNNPYQKTTHPQSIVDINPTSATYLQNIPNPKAGKSNYNLTTVSHSIATGAAEFAAFMTGLELTTAAVKGGAKLAGMALTAEAAQSAAMTTYMVVHNYENNWQRGNEVMGEDASEIGKAMYATLSGYIDKLAFDVLPKDKLFLSNQAKAAMDKELSPLLKDLTIKNINKEVLQTKVQKVVQGLINTSKEVGHITAAMDAAAISKAVVNSVVGKDEPKKYFEEAWHEIKQNTVEIPLTMGLPLGVMEVVKAKQHSSFFKENVYSAGLEPNKYIALIRQELGKGNLTPEEANSRMEVVKTMHNIVQSTPDINPLTNKPFTHNQQVEYAYNRLKESGLRAKALEHAEDPAISSIYLRDAQDLADVRKAMLESYSKQPKQEEAPKEKTIPQQKVDIERQRQDELERNPKNANNINAKFDAEIAKLSEQEKIPSEKTNEEIVPDLTVGDLLDKTGKYKGQDGLFYLDGQTVVFKVEGKNKEYELGNINEIKDSSIKDFGIEHKESVVTIGDNGELIVRGQEYKNRYSDPLMAIDRDADGNVTGVTLETNNGNKRRFKGNTAEDIAYQIHLQEITKNNETRQFEEFINEPEQQQQIDNGAVPETTTEDAVTTDEPIQREKIEPIQQSEQPTSEVNTQTEVPEQKTVEQLRAEEQAELDSKIPNAEQYRVDGKIDRDKLTKEEGVGEEIGKYPLEDKSKWQSLGDEQYKGELAYMTPDEFLSKAKALEMNESDRKKIDKLKQHILDGKKLDPLEIYSNIKNVLGANIDGRHRAVAAKELGIKEVPVIDYTKEAEVPKQKKKQPKGKAAKFVAENLAEPDSEGEGEPKPVEEGEPEGAVPTQTHTVETIDQVDTTGFNDKQKKNVSDVKRILKAITKLVGKDISKKLKVVIHSTRESAAKAAYDSTIKGGGTEAEARENMQNQGNRGWWASADGEIHLNMAEVSSETALHEGVHPILDAIAKIKPEAIDQFHKQLEALPQGKEIIDLAKKNYAEYDSQGNVTNSPTVKNEAITDYIAKVADGQIKIDRSNFEKVKDYVINLLTKLGVMPEKDIRSIDDLRKLAQMVSEKFAKGEEIKIDEGGMPLIKNSVEIPSIDFSKIKTRKVKVGTHKLSFVKKSDIIDIENLLKEISNKKQKVWFWVADQLGRGMYSDTLIEGQHYLDAGASFALDPENRGKNIIWATGKDNAWINKNIENSDYIFIISGSPEKSKLFNKTVFDLFGKRIKDYEKFKQDVLSVSKIKEINTILNEFETFDDLRNSPKRKDFLIAINEQQGKKTPLVDVLNKYNSFIEFNDLRDGFYKDNDFKLNDVMLVLKPKSVGGKSKHSTYENDLLGDVVGVPDKVINSYDLLPNDIKDKYKKRYEEINKELSLKNKKELSFGESQKSQAVAPYGSKIHEIQFSKKKIKWEESKEGKGDPSISSRNPVVQEAAAKLKEGKITNEEYRAVASENSPIRPITRFFEPATEDRIKSALSEDKIDKVNIPVEDGKEVGLRLDIPAYKNNNTWVVSVHEGTTNAGKAISYTNVAKIKDVNFGVEPKAALAIAAGVPKTTIGRMFGKWENIEGDTLESKGDNAKKIIQDIVNDPNYVQVGMNPFRHSYFYDRSSDIGRPIKSAEEVIQVGGLVYAKKPVYGDWTDEAYRVKGLLDAGQKPIQFSKTKLPQQREEVKGTLDGKPVTFVKQPDNVEVVDGFYSPIEKRLTETKIDKQSANKWREIVGKGDEAKFTGVLGWLESLPPTQQVSKSEIQKWMKDNRIEINEVVKGGQNKQVIDYEDAPKSVKNILEKRENGELHFAEMVGELNEIGYDVDYDMDYEVTSIYKKDTQPTKYENYQLPGEKTNYKEVLITIPSKTNETRLQELIQKKRDKTITEQEEIEFQKLDKKLEGNFQSSHYDEPNILAHIRMNTRVDAEGNKVLHIEEFQSDFGQKAKKEGFLLPEKEKNKLINELEGNKQRSLDIIVEMKDAFNKEDINKVKELSVEDSNLNKRNSEINDLVYKNKGVPEAPFVSKTSDWTKLAWKVALKEAVKEGADKITWTTGEQQNDRYDLSKSVDEITYSKSKDGKYQFSGSKNEVQTFNYREIPENKLEDYVGKEVAQKIINNEGELLSYGNKEEGTYNELGRILSGVDLKVGGTGMKGFYGSPSESKLGIVGEVAKSLFKQEPSTTEINQSPDFVKQKLTVVNEPNEPMGRVWLVVSNEGEVRGRFSSKEEANQEKIRMQKQREDAIKTSTQHSIDITPDMKAQVESGMPMFSKTRDKKMSDMKDILKEYVDEGKSLDEIKDILKDEFGDYYKDVEGIIEQAHQEMTTTGIKNAVTERERAERGLSEVEVEAKRSFGKVFDDAKQMIANGVANGLTLAAEIIKNPRPLKAEESAVLLIDRMRISNEYNKKNAELLEAQEKGETDKADIIQSQMEALEEEMDLNDEAARKSGYEQGLGLAARRMLIAQDYSLVTQMNRLKAANGGAEVPKQYQEQLKSLITQLEEANNKLEKLDKTQAGTEKQKEVSKVKPVSRTPEQIATEKQNIKSKIVAKWGQTLARMKAATSIKRAVSPTPVTPQKQAQLESIVKDVNDMVKLYAESGVTDLKKIIDNVHQDLVGSMPGLDRVDIEDIVLGRYDTQKPKTPLTPAKIQAQANVRRVKTQIDLLKEELKNKQRGGVEKAVDYLHGWHRFSILSGVPSAFKIGTAALTRGIVTRGENIVGQALSLIPGIRKVAKQAPREGGFNPKAESKAFSSWFDKMTRDDMAKVMNTGISEIDYLYGAKEPKAPGVPKWMEFFGRMHSAIKLLPKRAEFFRSLEMRTEQAIKEGKNPNDVVVQQELGVAAYNDALRSIFMQDNILTENYQAAIRKYEQTQPTTASLLKFLFPIVKVPSNYVAEQSSYIPVVAAVKAITALYKGRKGMTPEQADFFMRALKKGSIGTAFIALGFFNPVNFGGYYTGKRKKDDLEAGDIELFGVKLPHFMLHTPLLEMLQVGSTMRRAAESQLAKGEEPSKTLGMYTGGIPAVLKGQLTQIPFIGTGERTMKLLENKTADGIKEFGNSMVQSVVEPQFMQNLADFIDKEDGKTVKRESKGLVEKLKEGAPGLRQTLKQDKSKFTDKEYEEFSNITEKGLNIPELNKRTTYKVKIDTKHPDGHMTEEEYDEFIPLQKEYVKDAYKKFYGSHKSDFDRLQKMVDAVPETPEEKAKMNALKDSIQNKIDAVHNEAIKAAKRKIGLTQK